VQGYEWLIESGDEVSKADKTKNTIAAVFRSLLEAKPARSVSVQNIVDVAGVNRKTFYYYFSNKEDLVIWIFRQDLASLLKTRFPEDQLIGDVDSGNPMDDFGALPYYVRIKAGVRTLDQSPFLRLLAECLYSQRKYYKKTFASQMGLQSYLIQLYRYEFIEDINYILSGRFMPEESKLFLADYFSQAFISFLVESLLHNKNSDYFLSNNTEPFLNITHECLKGVIEAHPMQYGTIQRFWDIFENANRGVHPPYPKREN
jgi:AcrR family transcriptional regulator